MYDDDFPQPTEDPFDHACREAARRLADGEELTASEWELLGQRASAELHEHDLTNTF